MNNKGFTLVELLSIIILLIIIFMLVVPTANTIINSGKETVYQSQIDRILNSAHDWSLKNPNFLPEKNSEVFITLGMLKNDEFIDSDIKDPYSKELFQDNLVISIKNVGGNYKYSNKNSKLDGDFLFTVETEFLEDQTYISRKPKIILTGLTPNSEGNYVTNVDLGSVFQDVNYTSKSYKNVDLTNNVVKNIMFNEKKVSTIDTNKVGIYSINYTVIDSEGYSTTVVRSVIVSDLSAPELILPSNVTINRSVTTFNLMEDVSCVDNSRNCDITTSGTINFGVPGKYIIEYTAKDPSGNSITKKRVITIN